MKVVLSAALTLVLVAMPVARCSAQNSSGAPSFLANSEPIYSPDGTHAARLGSPRFTGYHTIVSTIILSNAKDPSLDKFEQNFPYKVNVIHWLADGKSVVFLAKAHTTSPLHLYESNWQTKLTRDLTPFAGRDVDKFWLSKNFKVLIVSLNLEDKEKHERWIVDTASGALRPVPRKNYVEGTSIEPDNLLIVDTAPSVTTPPSNAAVVKSSNARLDSTNGSAQQNFHHYHIQPVEKIVAGQEAYLPLIRDNAEQRILFMEPSPSLDKELNAKSLPFTESEKLQFTSAWKQICALVPGLALRAAHGERLRVVRERSCSLPKNYIVGTSAAAGSGNGVLVLYDDFFRSGGAHVSMTVHELTHEADLFCHLSLSPEWVSLIDPIVAASHDAFAFSKKYGLKNLDDSGAKYFGLPSMYAANNHMESLAEWTSHYVTGTTPPAGIKKFIEDKVLNPNCKEEVVDQKVLRAFLNIEAEKFDLAERELCESISADPDYLKPYFFLTRLYIRTNSIANALKTSNELIKRMDALHIRQQTIGDFPWYNAQHADILARMHDYVNSQKYLSKAMAAYPDDQDFLDSQKILNQLKKKAGRNSKAANSEKSRRVSTH